MCMCFASLLLVDWIWIDSKRKWLEAFISMDNCIIFFILPTRYKGKRGEGKRETKPRACLLFAFNLICRFWRWLAVG